MNTASWRPLALGACSATTYRRQIMPLGALWTVGPKTLYYSYTTNSPSYSMSHKSEVSKSEAAPLTQLDIFQVANHEGNNARSVPKYFGGASSASSSIISASSSSVVEPSVASVVAAMAPLSAPIGKFHTLLRVTVTVKLSLPRIHWY